jgi:hypothetical protein
VGVAAAVVTGISSGNLGQALRAGFVSAVTAFAFTTVGDLTAHGALAFGSETHLLNVAGHALVGCGSAVASGGRCGPGALSGAVGSFAGPLLKGLNFGAKLVATSVLGGLASVAGGGKFANGAVTAAFGYLFNSLAHEGAAARQQPAGQQLAYCVPCAVPLGQLVVDALTIGIGLFAITNTPDPYQTIYRAIGPAELAALEATGTYGFSPNASGKYFALSEEGVYQFANSSFNAGEDMTITSTKVPTKVLGSGYFFNDPGGAGASVHFTDPQLPKLYSTMTPVQILPRNR